MIPADRRSKGHPLYALIGVVALYIVARVLWWQSPFPNLEILADRAKDGSVLKYDGRVEEPLVATELAHSAPVAVEDRGILSQVSSAGDAAGPVYPPTNPMPRRFRQTYFETLDTQPIAGSARVAASAAIPDVTSANTATDEVIRDELDRPRAKRWSLDGWLFYRPENKTNVGGADGFQAPTYGASQAGLILRYQIKPGDRRAPTAFMRATFALDSDRQQDLALGISAIPLPNIPAVIAAETRVSRQGNRTEIRPAVFAYTAIDPQPLPHSFRAEIYGQAGYVGGAFATPFVDAALRVDREVQAFDLGQVRAGAGLWGGAQKDTRRLDVGPAISLIVDVGGAPVRLAADYRRRVAGNAQPRSGVAITASAGF